jgi:aspartate aminotransferase-like enzyme
VTVNLRIPGPTPVPDPVLAAMSRPMINHRGPEFATIIREVTASLQRCFRTTGDVLTLTASGTGGLEAAVVNTLSPGDPVLAVSIGFFGDRLGEIAGIYGADVTRLEFPAGRGADPEQIRQHLRRRPDTRAVLVTHNESSTGVTNPLREIAAVVRETEALLIVDAVSSIVGIDVRTDEWGLDVVTTASQKAWAAPPGLAMLSLSQRAWAAYKVARMPRYYWDLGLARSWLERGQTLATPAISVFFALHEALRMLEAEGLDEAIARHRRIGERIRAGVQELGLELFADPAVASNTVTAVRAPPGVDGNAIVATLRDEHGIELAGGQGAFAGKLFRIGHLGWVTEADMDLVVEALRVALPKLGHRIGAGVRR